MIHYHGFTKRYGDLLAVDGLDLAIAEGETVALIGPNGSGKTTTLKALVGLVQPTAGRITIDGRDATTEGPAARAALGYLPQRLTFPEGMTGRDAMQLYARLRRAAPAEARSLLERVGLAEAADRAIDGYSGGMRQRLGIAIALLGRPRALVLDEPSAALDPSGALLVRDLIRDIAADGTTVLLSSHDLAEVAGLAGRIVLFLGGRVRAAGTLRELETRTGGQGLESVYRSLVGAAGSGLSMVRGAA